MAGAALVAATVGFWWPAKDSGAQGGVAACQQAHAVPATGGGAVGEAVVPPGGVPNETLRWSGCTWPPLPGADEDGYWEVTVRRTTTAGPGSDEPNTDTITTSCPQVVASFRPDVTGASNTWEYTWTTGQIVELTSTAGAPPSLEVTPLPPEMYLGLGTKPNRDLILRTSVGLRLAQARCADEAPGPAPS